MHPLVKKVVPTALRLRLRAIMETQMRNDRAAELKDIPTYDLSSKHVANLEALATRQDLLAHLPPRGVAAEMGVSRGRFTADILRINQPRKLHLIDVWNSARYEQSLKQAILDKFSDSFASGQLEINEGYSTTVVDSFPDSYFDWIYIDTDHSYSTTRDELALYERKMKPGGIIAGHDYAVGNWKAALKFGVVEAVYEFCVTRDWELLHITMECKTTNPSFAIRRSEV
jgi:hypothetical protein